MSQKQPVIALVGNPNTGKTTLFNMLTGLSQRTGNFPGVTVEKKVGFWQLPDGKAEVIDLPGTYSLAAVSPDELVVSETLLHMDEKVEAVDVILVVVNAACLHRNLYLVSQLLELRLPMVLALNMIDQADARQLVIDAEVLSQKLGIPVVPTNASGAQGLDELATAVSQQLKSPMSAPHDELFPEVRSRAHLLASLLSDDATARVRLTHHAFRALCDEEGHAEVRLRQMGDTAFAQALEKEKVALAEEVGRPIEMEARRRYQWVQKILLSAQKTQGNQDPSLSDRVDRLLTHPILGMGVLVLILALIFQTIYTWAGPLMDGIDGFIGSLGALVGGFLPDGMLRSLVVDGMIGGVGAVVVFLPQIMLLFCFIAILEDCGYMARAAFLMDKLFNRCGLSGKSLIPLLSSFACAIPGMMATRTINDRRDRMTTVLVAPFMSCSARLPVYVIMISAFIPEKSLFGPFGLQGLVLLGMYLVGVLVAIPTAWLLKRTLFKGASPPFLMELPSYKVPSLTTVGLRVWMSGREFILRAGTTILAVTVVVWALTYFPRDPLILEQFANQRSTSEQVYKQELQAALNLPESDARDLQALETALQAQAQGQAKALKEAHENKLAEIDHLEEGELQRSSYLGRMGQFVEPVVAPLGWDWRIGMATIASFPAREIIVATLGVIFNLGADETEDSVVLRDALHAAVKPDGSKLFNIPVALSIMIFFALCAQCAATLAVIKKETGSWRYPIYSFTYMTGLAYVAAMATYHGAKALGL